MNREETTLGDEEKKIWSLWKETFKSVFDRIVEETYAATGIADGDYMVLDLLTRSGKGTLRQYELADKMGWTKSRLSHHLTRMEKRKLVTRRTLEKGVQVSITSQGRSAYAAAVPVVSNGIRKYLLANLTAQDTASIKRIAAKVEDVLKITS